MKTRLHLEAPPDLSVGTVRISTAGQQVADWVATPETRTFQSDDAIPGVYTVQISPAGVPPQSVVFEVKEGQGNTVALPAFSALSTSGSNLNFFDSDLERATSECLAEASEGKGGSADPAWPRHTDAVASPVVDSQASLEPKPLSTRQVRRRIAVGLSEDRRGKGEFNALRQPASTELVAGKVELDLPDIPGRDAWLGDRVRLTISVEGVRIERCLLPLYAAGTRVCISSSPLSTQDVEFSILPIAPRLRALVRVLDAGTSAEAIAVRDEVLCARSFERLNDGEDPWEVMLVGLLSIRFPRVFPALSLGLANALAANASWAFDSHVILANTLLAASAAQSSAHRRNAIKLAIDCLGRAQRAGSPYYRASNELFSEIAGGIASQLRRYTQDFDPRLIERFDRVNRRYLRDVPLQRGSGPTFSWMARDLKVLREKGTLAPHRSPSGRLPRARTTVIFEGVMSAGQIAVASRHPRYIPESEPLGGAPGDFPSGGGDGLPDRKAVRMADLASSDPNNGKFGESDRRAGFHLYPEFDERPGSPYVGIVLTVEVERSVRMSLGDVAHFYLHPTFSPSIVKVPFQGGRARLRIQAWGGFTVGVHVPSADVFLECDLAKVPGAPRVIRTL